MLCQICHSEVEEYIRHKNQNQKGPVLRRLECPACGTLHFKNLLPVKDDVDEAGQAERRWR